MQLTILCEAAGGTEQQVRSFDVDPAFMVGDFIDIVAADLSIESGEAALFHKGRALLERSIPLSQIGLEEHDMLVLVAHGKNESEAAPMDGEVERVRRRIVADAGLREKLMMTQPELARAAIDDPERFQQLFRLHHEQVHASRSSPADPLDAAAQERIEEMIRQRNISENLESAMEYHPESFGSVTMLYINCRVNDTEIKAFVDCGAQTTIMSEACGRRCGLDRLIDSRFSGIAKGVGTSKIVGRVHSVQLCIGNQFLPCAVTVIEGDTGPDMLIGLDMLKRHQAILDLGKGVIIVHGVEIPFLGESDLPREQF